MKVSFAILVLGLALVLAKPSPSSHYGLDAYKKLEDDVRKLAVKVKEMKEMEDEKKAHNLEDDLAIANQDQNESMTESETGLPLELKDPIPAAAKKPAAKKSPKKAAKKAKSPKKAAKPKKSPKNKGKKKTKKDSILELIERNAHKFQKQLSDLKKKYPDVVLNGATSDKLKMDVMNMKDVMQDVVYGLKHNDDVTDQQKEEMAEMVNDAVEETRADIKDLETSASENPAPKDDQESDSPVPVDVPLQFDVTDNDEVVPKENDKMAFVDEEFPGNDQPVDDLDELPKPMDVVKEGLPWELNDPIPAAAKKAAAKKKAAPKLKAAKKAAPKKAKKPKKPKKPKAKKPKKDSTLESIERNGEEEMDETHVEMLEETNDVEEEKKNVEVEEPRIETHQQQQDADQQKKENVGPLLKQKLNDLLSHMRQLKDLMEKSS